MNPDTGTFHPIAEDAIAAAQQLDSGEIGKDWPVFAIGEAIDIKGYQFKILRINMSSMVVQPIPTRGLDSPRKLVRAMTGRDA